MSGDAGSWQHQALMPAGQVPSFLQLSFDPQLLARPAAAQPQQQQAKQRQQPLHHLQQQQQQQYMGGQLPPLPPQPTRTAPITAAVQPQQQVGQQPLGSNLTQQQQQLAAAALAYAAAEAAQQQYNSQQQQQQQQYSSQQQQYSGYDPQQYAAGYGGSENGGSYGYYAAGGSRGGRGGGRGRGRGRRATSSEPGTGSEAEADDEQQQQLQQGWPKRRRKGVAPLEAEARLLLLGFLSAAVQDAAVLNQCLLTAMNQEAQQQQQSAAAVDEEDGEGSSRMSAVMAYQLAQSLASNLRGRPRLSLLWQLGLDFSQARNLLAAGSLVSLEDVLQACTADCSAALAGCNAAAAAAGQSRQQLEAQVELLLELLADSAEQLLAEAGLIPDTRTHMSGKPLPHCITANKEPFAHKAWRKTPYEPRPYVELRDYAITSNVPAEARALRWKLTTRRRDGAGDGFRDKHSDLSPEQLEQQEQHLVQQVLRRAALVKGRDVHEVDCWGMDCYTRRNVFDAVLEADVFKHLRGVGPRALEPHQQQQQQQDGQRLEQLQQQQEQQQHGSEASAGADSMQAMKQEHDALRELSLQPQQQQQQVKQEQKQQEAGTPPQQLLQAAQASNSQGLEQLQLQQQQQPASARQSTDVQVAPAAASSVPGSGDAVAGAAVAADGERSRCSSEVAAGGCAGQPCSMEAGLARQQQQHCRKYSQAEEDAVHEWIDRVFLPAINQAGTDGWDIVRVANAIKDRAQASGDETSAAAAEAVLCQWAASGYPWFRLHPKGRGVVVARQEGVPAFTFVEEYFGQLHTGWRWFEMQDAIKKITQKELPDFYNILLERPRDDPDGYDALFVDAAFMGAFASRMSHSCTPNCQAIVVSCGGKLTVALYTIRAVAPGEELTFDYSSVTESEEEFKQAFCMCSTRACRGSYLYYTGSKAYMQ
eukprot:jgi/Sobl393_1/12606/SZX60780.1